LWWQLVEGANKATCRALPLTFIGRNEMMDSLEREWIDIRSEQYRVYVFPGGDMVRIEKPEKLHVSGSGGHRILSADGVSHYIPPIWFHLYWVGNPAFVK